ncbi:MAG: hypothetical protein HKN89_06890 [Eudoraea sp.]|nr:hypothetical protein [Eudoraea sp.]
MKKVRNFGVTVACIAMTSLVMGNTAVYTPDTDPVVKERPYLREDGERVFLNLLNLEMEEVKVRVVDERGRILYTEVIKDEIVIEKSFNFENAYEGTYRIVIIRSGERFVKKVLVS